MDLNRDHYKETDDGVYHSEHFIQIQDEYFLVLRSETIENVDGVFYNDLIIPNVRENDAGNYICCKIKYNKMHFHFMQRNLMQFQTQRTQWDTAYGVPLLQYCLRVSFMRINILQSLLWFIWNIL